MSNAIVDLLPLMVGATVVPFYPIVVLLLLQGQGGLVKALAFVAGGLAVRLAQGVLFGVVFGAAMQTSSEDGQRLGVSTLLLIVGILLLVTAVKKWQKEEDPDEPPAQWMSGISDLSAVKAASAGVLFVTVAVKQWVFTLSAISVISESVDAFVQQETTAPSCRRPLICRAFFARTSHNGNSRKFDPTWPNRRYCHRLAGFHSHHNVA